MSMVISLISRCKHFFDHIDRLEERATYAQAGLRPDSQS